MDWTGDNMDMSPSTRRGFLLAASTVALATPACAQLNGHDSHKPTLTTGEKERKAFSFRALKVFVEIDSKDTNGAVAILRVFVPPGDGAAPHMHSREDEVFTVVRGHYRFRHGEMEVDAPPGTVVFLPRGEPHTFRNISAEPGEHTLTLIPGGLENYFREIGALQRLGPLDTAKVAEIANRYGLTQLPPSSLPLSTG